MMQIVDLGPETGLVLGRVVAMHVRADGVIDAARHYIDTPKLKLIGRMHAGWYTRTSNLFQMEHIFPADWRAHKHNKSQHG